MEEMIGYCGYNCHLCAARSEDVNVRKKLVNAWRKYLGHEKYTVENVFCEGCKSKGNKIADINCKARPCAREKVYESCAQCDEFPCDKVKHLITHSAELIAFRWKKFKDLTEEEYDLCVRQWHSIPNLINVLIDEGKLPKFIGEKLKN